MKIATRPGRARSRHDEDMAHGGADDEARRRRPSRRGFLRRGAGIHHEDPFAEDVARLGLRRSCRRREP